MILTSTIFIGLGSLLDVGDGFGKIHDAIDVNTANPVNDAFAEECF